MFVTCLHLYSTVFEWFFGLKNTISLLFDFSLFYFRNIATQ